MRIKNTLQAFLIVSLTSACWGQTSAITSIVNGLGQPRFSPGDGAAIYGSFPSGRRADFTVTFGTVPAYITLVANDGKLNRGFEIDVQVPTEVSPGNTSVVVSYQGGATPPFPISIVALDPAMQFDAFSTFLHTSGVSVMPAAPASPGETITTFMNGLGLTNPPVPTGTEPADFTPTSLPVTVNVGGTSAQVIFAGRYASHSISPALNYQVSFVVPPNASNGPASVTVFVGDAASNTQTLFIGSPPLPSPPTIKAVVSAASFASTALVPGSIMSLFGTGFGTQDNLSAFPSTQVNGISVLFNGQPAPIFALAASGGQINVLVPAEIQPTQESVHGIAVAVVSQNGPSKATFLSGGPAAPGMFLVPDPSNTSRHNIAALLANTAWYVMPASQAQALGLSSCAGLAVTARCGQPAKRGDFVQLYATGLGLATPNGNPNGSPLATGQVAPADGSQIYYTVAQPAVTVGGQPAKVQFSGIAPGFAGLYQVNFQIPLNAPTGDSVAITITMPGSATDSATLAVQ
ncbi:MAG TPA: hypothetical protein VEU96_21825 [Bryobacteraceae bacterium]|nr:hypothetical protein [Bryobacteraceae bacterium]